MRKAYILIDTRSPYIWEVVRALRRRPGVAWADAVSGPPSIICVLEEANARAIASTHVPDIRNLKGVERVVTCFAIEGG
jgi:hypothetical protein